MKIKVTETIKTLGEDFDQFGYQHGVAEMSLSALMEKYGHLENVVVFANDYGDDYYNDPPEVTLSLRYDRDETDEEHLNRLDQEEKQRQKSEKAKEKRLLKKQSEKEAAQAEFERLKKTYGFQ